MNSIIENDLKLSLELYIDHLFDCMYSDPFGYQYYANEIERIIKILNEYGV